MRARGRARPRARGALPRPSARSLADADLPALGDRDPRELSAQAARAAAERRSDPGSRRPRGGRAPPAPGAARRRGGQALERGGAVLWRDRPGMVARDSREGDARAADAAGARRGACLARRLDRGRTARAWRARGRDRARVGRGVPGSGRGRAALAGLLRAARGSSGSTTAALGAPDEVETRSWISQRYCAFARACEQRVVAPGRRIGAPGRFRASAGYRFRARLRALRAAASDRSR